MAILVKQWLREYPAVEITSPQQHIRIRHFRYLGLVKWQVFEIAAALPILLQVALVLFFLGLGDFARGLHPVLGWIVTSLTIGWLVLYGATTFMPLLSCQCPYKTPLIRTALQRIHRAIFGFLDRFTQLEWKMFHDEARILQDPDSDVAILADVSANFWTDHGILGKVRECLSVADANDVVEWMQGVSKHLGCPIKGAMETPSFIFHGHPGSTSTMRILDDALGRELRGLDKSGDQQIHLSGSVRMALRWLMQDGVHFPEISGSVGELVSRLLSHSRNVAKDVVQSFWEDDILIQLDHDAPPWIEEHMVRSCCIVAVLINTYHPISVLFDAISAVQSIALTSKKKDPLRLCFSLLSLARRTDTDVLEELRPIFRHLVDFLSASIIPEVLTLDFGYSVNTLAFTCVNLTEQLNLSVPDLISEEAISHLRDITL